MDSFYRNKRVFVTGHTGFKGAWLCRILHRMGAQVYGYSLKPPTDPNLYEILHTDSYVHSKIGDISDLESVERFFQDSKPNIVFHLAAQPLVREGYRNPHRTYQSNVMGTVNILECIRKYGCDSFVNITTDKVYDNNDEKHSYSENDRLDGYDPYSNSKSCSELITHSYKRSFADLPPISTARAGNVIGGGDFAFERIIPDCVRAALMNEKVVLRNPQSIRPYQHVLEPLYSYLALAWKQCEDPTISGSYNIGPDEIDSITTGDLVTKFCQKWGNGMGWISECDGGPHESNYLMLDNNKMKQKLGIAPLWHIEEAVSKTVEWTKEWAATGDGTACLDRQIEEYLAERGVNV